MTQELQQEKGLVITEQSFLALNKGSINDLGMSLVDKCRNGEASPTEALIMAKKLTELSELIKNNVADMATNELKLANKETRHMLGCEIREQTVGTRYDFSTCQDLIWNRLSKELKEREAILKALSKPMEMVDTDTAETWTAYPPVKSGKLSLVITVK
jgi:hypothetical protein